MFRLNHWEPPELTADDKSNRKATIYLYLLRDQGKRTFWSELVHMMKNVCTTTIQSVKEGGQHPRNHQLHLDGQIFRSNDEVINDFGSFLDSRISQFFTKKGLQKLPELHWQIACSTVRSVFWEMLRTCREILSFRSGKVLVDHNLPAVLNGPKAKVAWVDVGRSGEAADDEIGG
ncbi:hypothetical protein TNCV_1930281 [Trichonephila clavipes]|nr:hypothetical protein TNCV_1930281 [Trichonephila clavipes]